MEADLPVETVLRKDIEASGKKIKQFASQVYPDKSHTNATDRMWKALSGRSPRLKGIEWLETCKAVNQSYFSLRYFNETLTPYLSETQIMDLVVRLMQQTKKRLTDENLELLTATLNNLNGFASPKRLDNSLNLLDAQLAQAESTLFQAFDAFKSIKQTRKILEQATK